MVLEALLVRMLLGELLVWHVGLQRWPLREWDNLVDKWHLGVAKQHAQRLGASAKRQIQERQPLEVVERPKLEHGGGPMGWTSVRREAAEDWLCGDDD